MLKVTIYQKSLEADLSTATLKKLGALKSDFLLLPEYFHAPATASTPKELLAAGGQALDWLSRLSDEYRGVIVGGTVPIAEDGKLFNAAPVVSDGAVIDYYRQRRPAKSPAGVAAGEEAGVFILAGQRFAVLIGDDLNDAGLLQELAEMGIRTILVPMCVQIGQDNFVADLSANARTHALHIACCCGVGTLFGKKVLGRSMMVTPQGVSWRVADQEEDREILKTVMFNVQG